MSQALAKLERGYARDLEDVRAMLSRGLVAPSEISSAFDEIREGLVRFPSVDPDVFESNVRAFLAAEKGDDCMPGAPASSLCSQ